MPQRIRIATRSTPLALIQTEIVACALRDRGHEVERLELRSLGDRSLGGNLTVRRGVFTAELDDALLEQRADLAVHSLKDLPLEIDPRLAIVAVLARASPCDLLLIRKSDFAKSGGPGWRPLDELLEKPAEDADPGCSASEAFECLEEGAVIGTSSPRRQSGALSVRPDLVCCAVRGSVGRRLEWLASGAVQALLLAEAGLVRLFEKREGIELFPEVVARRLSPHAWPPAPGQGALAVVALADRWRDHPSLQWLSHGDTWAAVEHERSVLGHLGGGCSLPLGAYCRAGEGRPTELSVILASEDWRDVASVASAPLVHRLERVDLGGAKSASSGSKDELERLKQAAMQPTSHSSGQPSGTPELVITSSRATTERLAASLPRRAGRPVQVAEFPVTETVPLESPWPVQVAKEAIEEATRSGQGRRHWPWLLVSSPAAAEVLFERSQLETVWSTLPWCALGAGTARALLGLGCPPNLVAGARDAHEFAAFVAEHLGTAGRTGGLIVPRSQLADEALPRSLTERGFRVHAFAAYTRRARAGLRWPVAGSDTPKRALFTSPSAVSAIADAALALPEVCWAIGASTARAMSERGIAVAGIAESPTAQGVAGLWR